MKNIFKLFALLLCAQGVTIAGKKSKVKDYSKWDCKKLKKAARKYKQRIEDDEDVIKSKSKLIKIQRAIENKPGHCK